MSDAFRPDPENLERILDAALTASDPVPPHVTALAKAVPALAALDEALLELVEQELAAPVRGASATLTFASAAQGISVEVIARTGADARLELDGIVEPALAGEVRFERLASAAPASPPATRLDEHGQFVLRHLEPGIGRIVVVASGGRRLVCAWQRW